MDVIGENMVEDFINLSEHSLTKARSFVLIASPFGVSGTRNDFAKEPSANF